MSANNSTCHTFSEREVDAIFTTRVIVATLSLTTCLFTLLMLSAMVCCLRVWKTFVHRLKLYLTAVALVLSVMYLLQVLPTRSRAVETPDAASQLQRDWNNSCKAIAFFLQYVDWVLLILICWMITYVLWLVHRINKPPNAINFHQYNHKWLEVLGIVLTLTFPLLFIWVPFITDDYGLGDIWCGDIIRQHSLCSNRNESIEPGLGYLVGTWYAPGITVAFLCTIGVFLVVGYIWVYYQKKGYTDKMNTAIVQGIPPAVYLLIYNAISCLDIASLLYHYESSVTRGGVVDYRLWLMHAVTGPCRALAIPFAFVLGRLCVRLCCRDREKGPYKHLS